MSHACFATIVSSLGISVVCIEKNLIIEWMQLHRKFAPAFGDHSLTSLKSIFRSSQTRGRVLCKLISRGVPLGL